MAEEFIYSKLVRPLLFRLDPELAHRLTLGLLALARPQEARPDPPELGVTLWNRRFANPIGLAAGMDKDARAAWAWQALGFGFAELGTVTPRPQPGNPRPRLWRLPEHQALVNRLGFPSAGMERVGRRIRLLRRAGIGLRLGINIGPNLERTGEESLAEDLLELIAALGPLADFVVINLSSPNTPGLRAWQAPKRMRALAEKIAAPGKPGGDGPPLAVKISPDLDPESLREVVRAARELKLDGLVVANTSAQRETLGVSFPAPGGLSGAPLRRLTPSLVAQVFRLSEGALPIIGVGGVASGQDAYDYIRAGARLVELYTALVYQGPTLVRRIKAELAALLRRDGFASVADAVGGGAS